MSKAILTFDLPDDNMEFNQACRAKNMAIALYDISNLWTKHKLPDSVDDYTKRIFEILEENSINLEELIE